MLGPSHPDTKARCTGDDEYAPMKIRDKNLGIRKMLGLPPLTPADQCYKEFGVYAHDDICTWRGNNKQLL